MSKREEKRQEILKELREGMRAKQLSSGNHKRGAFGIEAKAEHVARRLQRELIEEEIRGYDRGYEGNTRRCFDWCDWCHCRKQLI